jgi:hypothetical protein
MILIGDAHYVIVFAGDWDAEKAVQRHSLLLIVLQN